MRFGPAGYPIRSKNPKDAMNIIKEMGLDALEMEYVRGAKVSEASARALGKMASERNIRLSAHAPYYISFNSDNQETREKSAAHVINTAKAAQYLGAHIIVIHAAFYGKDQSSKVTATVIEWMNKCKEIMDNEGIRDVTLGLETMGRASAWGTLKEISKVMESVDGVRPVLDVAHVHARNGGSLRTKEDMKKLVDEFFPLAGDKPHFHISCIEYSDKGEKNHLPLSAKDPDMSLLAEVLNDYTNDSTFVCESPLLEEDAIAFKRMFPRYKI
jgi:deoxyribonuclease-4